jgi:hypothetical protein
VSTKKKMGSKCENARNPANTLDNSNFQKVIRNRWEVAKGGGDGSGDGVRRKKHWKLRKLPDGRGVGVEV